MSIPTYQPPQPTAAFAEPMSMPVEEWELKTTVTRAPTPIVEACGTGDGCAKTCASSCASS
ncbi:FxLD family lantipeptide [Streptomyces coelicoflavus]|uniref:FxLD family lantipeptide n=1 Tax=Streptomyces coelicoflavus TaxID=285562 RepID=UPI0032518D8B